MNLIYEQAGVADVEEIFTQCKNLIDRYEDIRQIEYDKVLAWVHGKIEENIHEYFRVSWEGQKVGYYRSHEAEDEVELDDLYIFPAFQNRGIGTAILRKCCGETTKPIFFYVFRKNVRAIALYERLGFRIVENIRNTRYIMRREGNGVMSDYALQNKKAWEFDVYDFWCRESGMPQERARKALEDPLGMLKRYAAYFDAYEGVRVANICGSCGKKAVPLAILGAEVTIFDISEGNRRYALKVAEAAGVQMQFEAVDVMDISLEQYGDFFDVVFMEGGILHYFQDIDAFMEKMYGLLKPGGRMICSDFHPFTKIMDLLELEQPAMSYFSTEAFEGEMAHARFYDMEVRRQMPKCIYRKYTISEILNGVLCSGFVLRRFDEHPSWVNEKVPGEFTLVAEKTN